MRPFVKWNLVVLALAAGLAIGTSLAHADSFDWTITGPSASQSGSGTFTTDDLSGGTYVITGITGTYDGSSVSLNPAEPATSAFDGNDNLIYASLLLPDAYGISFTAGSDDINIADVTQALANNFPGAPVVGDQMGTQDIAQMNAQVASGVLSGNYTPVTLSIVAAPEPSSVALTLLGIWCLLVMRKRIAQGLPQAS